jgi:hypothetical protein
MARRGEQEKEQRQTYGKDDPVAQYLTEKHGLPSPLLAISLNTYSIDPHPVRG